MQRMKLYVQPEAIPGIWEYQGEQTKHNISNELVKENICKSLAPMSATTDKGRIASAIANEHHFHNSITRKNVLDLAWGCGPSHQADASDYRGAPPQEGYHQGYGGLALSFARAPSPIFFI